MRTELVFATNVFERLSFFFSVLPNEYLNDPMSLNKYFEAMNAGGKGLEQHEILKVQLMRGESNQENLLAFGIASATWGISS